MLLALSSFLNPTKIRMVLHLSESMETMLISTLKITWLMAFTTNKVDIGYRKIPLNLALQL